MSESLLSRRIQFSLSSEPSYPATQTQVDGLVTRFVDEAADLKTLAALTAGGIAYRFGKIGVMGSQLGHVPAMPLRPISIAFGLASEVTAFEFTNRTLLTLSARAGLKPAPTTNLWGWGGPGGWKQALINDTLTFGLLKGAGSVSRESNIIFQHTFASTAMVAGHQTAARFGITPTPEGTLAEQFLHAEATNIQLGAGTKLVHTLAPGISSLERGLDLSLRSFDRSLVRSWIDSERTHERTNARSNPFFQLASAMAGSPSLKNPHILQMSGNDDSPSDPDMTFIGPLPTASKETPKKPETFEELALSFGVTISSPSGPVGREPIEKALRARVMDSISQFWMPHFLPKDHLSSLRNFVSGVPLPETSLLPALKSLEEFLRLNNMLPSPTTLPPLEAIVPVESSPLGFLSDEPSLPRPQPKPKILRIKELDEVVRNRRIVSRSPTGQIQVSLRGKQNLQKQDLFDFYQIVFNKVGEFRQFMETLGSKGHDIQVLEPRLRKLDALLREASTDLIVRDGHKAHPLLEDVETQIESFQRDLSEIAFRAGLQPPLLEVDPTLSGAPSAETSQAQTSPQKDPILALFDEEDIPPPSSPKSSKPK